MPEPSAAELITGLASIEPGPERLDQLLKLASLYESGGKKTEGLSFTREAVELAAELRSFDKKAEALRIQGSLLEKLSRYPEALNAFTEAATWYETNRDFKKLVGIKTFIGKVYANLGDYLKALDCFYSNLALAENLNDRYMQATVYNSVSIIHQRMDNPEKALEASKHSLDIAIEIQDKRLKGISLINLGNAYGLSLKWDEAINCWNDSVLIFTELQDKVSTSSVLGNLGIASSRLGKFADAEAYFLRCLEIKEQLEEKFDTARCHQNLAELYVKMKDYAKAREQCDRTFTLASAIGAKSVIYQIHFIYSEIDKVNGDFKSALEHYELFHKGEKEILSEEVNLRTQAMKSRYDIEKMEKENEIYRLRNIDLAHANEQISFQKDKIEEQNKDIFASIRYAKRIQDAILPPKEFIESLLPDYFILYKPKDIIGGDFYWVDQKESKVLFAAADCTGHGIPGALMSIVGYNLLSQVVHQQNLSSPHRILNALNQAVSYTLRQSNAESGVKDGMDVTLCSWDLKTNKLEFAGAFNSMYLLRKGQLFEFKGDKFPVGIFIGDSPAPFTPQETQLEKGDVIYLFSDGYSDQFGGPKGKKFRDRQFKEVLLSLEGKSMNDQKIILENTIEDWKAHVNPDGGFYEQVDDIMVIGVKV